MKFVVNSKTDKLEDGSGVLYLVLFRLEEKDLVKIGVTTRTIEERVSEILVSIFKVYREFPYCRPKRFRTTSDVFEKETILHKYFEDCRYQTDRKFSGSSEFFEIPLEDAVTAYELLLAKGSLNESKYGAVQDS